MAEINVTDLMTDPDFVDPIQVVTREAYVNYLGESAFREVQLDGVGSVQPADFKTVQKLPEAMRVANVSSFWAKLPILASGPGFLYSSILIFKGVRYQVQTVADWSNWGQGYFEGTCIAQSPS